jgi:hypothetical protein
MISFVFALHVLVHERALLALERAQLVPCVACKELA